MPQVVESCHRKGSRLEGGMPPKKLPTPKAAAGDALLSNRSAKGGKGQDSSRGKTGKTKSPKGDPKAAAAVPKEPKASGAKGVDKLAAVEEEKKAGGATGGAKQPPSGKVSTASGNKKIEYLTDELMCASRCVDLCTGSAARREESACAMRDAHADAPRSCSWGTAALALTTRCPRAMLYILTPVPVPLVCCVIVACGRSSSSALRRRNRKPLDPKLREALVRKCGPPIQDVNFQRNEAKPPPGRTDDLAPSRHERVPPCRIVLMFNCYEASFALTQGDLATLSESETCDVRSLTSGKVLGRVRLSPEKGTPIEERIGMNDQWYVGSEHGLVHDGLQSDGFIELRLDWKTPHGDPKVALLTFNPWLAYGCGEGARVGVRKPGATEGTSATVQRSLRDDTVVVKRDGTDNELTVDPTPFTVVYGSSPRHQPGQRLLILHEGSCVDAVVEPWPDGEIDIKEVRSPPQARNRPASRP